MKSKNRTLSIIFLLLNACSEDDKSTATTPPTTTGTQSDSIVADNSSNLFSGLNGFRFDSELNNIL